MQVIPSNTATAALRRIAFTLVDATDLITPEDITVTGVKADLSIAGGTPAASTNDIVKVDGADGEYYLELTQAEANQSAGSVVRGWLTPSGCALTKFVAQIGPAGVMAEPLTEPVDANVTQWNGTNVATPATNGYPVVTLKVGTGTGELNVASGKAPATIAVGDLAANSVTASAVAADAVTEIANGVVSAEIAALNGLTASDTALTINSVAHTITRNDTDGYISSITAN